MLIVPLFVCVFSPIYYVYTMKRRVEDQEPIYASRQQQSRHPTIHSVAEGFQHRTLVPAPTVIEAATDNMQPSTGIQYSLPQGYQVSLFKSVQSNGVAEFSNVLLLLRSCRQCLRAQVLRPTLDLTHTALPFSPKALRCSKVTFIHPHPWPRPRGSSSSSDWRCEGLESIAVGPAGQYMFWTALLSPNQYIYNLLIDTRVCFFKVEDALSYLDQVKLQFGNQPQVYNDFLDIMKEFKSQRWVPRGILQIFHLCAFSSVFLLTKLISSGTTA